MLAKRRSLKLNNVEIERTPLLIPSFSSKGFPDIDKIVEYIRETIDGVALVSAYDIHYQKVKVPPNFASLLFIDSGGYAASKDTELSDFGDKEHISRAWTQEMHEATLAKLELDTSTVFISYDHPKERVSIKEQIKRALDMAQPKGGFLREILLKPETSSQTLLSIPEILKNIHALADFDIIGVTEKEVGNSIIHRMQNIAKLRGALDAAGLETPIHVFGSLDTITTPAYFVAGADIFDGLTWLRFAFYEGQTIYKQNYGALKLGVNTKAHVIDGRCWNDNYSYMKKLELEMRRFLKEETFTSFKYHGELFREALASAQEALGGGG